MAPDLRLSVFPQVSGVLTESGWVQLGIAVRSCRSWQERRFSGGRSEGDVPSPEDLTPDLGGPRESRARRGPHPLDNSLTTAAGREPGWTEGLMGPSGLLLQ